MKIITFSGIDGSGKTSQMEKIHQYLSAKGKKVQKFHLIEFSLANKIKRASFSKKGSSFSKTTASRGAILLRKIAFVIDAIRFQIYFRKNFSKIDFLLSDRFFQDQAINIFFLENKTNIISKPIWLRIGEFFLPSNIQNYCFLLKPEIAKERKQDENQDLQYYQKKDQLFRKAEKIWKFQYIKADKSKEEIYNQIKNKLDE